MSTHLKNSPSMLAPALNDVVTATGRRKSGRTRVRVVVTKTSKAKLPHERDESVSMTGGIPSEPMQQAYRDVTRGLQDTDRGAEANRTYKKLKR